MILLEPGNRILGETVASVINQDEEDNKAAPMDVKLCDFDDVSYHVMVSKDARNLLIVSMAAPFYSQIKDFGGDEALKRIYGSMVATPEDGYDVTLQVDLSNLPGKPEEVINKIQLLKANMLGSVFDYYFTACLKGTKLEKFRFRPRSDTEVFLVPAADRVTVVYTVTFQEKTDRVLARTFLNEFVDARKTLTAAPPVAWGPNPPLELKDFGVTTPEPGVIGYVSFAVQKNNIDKDKKDKVVAVMQNYRNYLQYHIKCSKAFFHSRMRARVTSMLALLNRAKADPVDDGKTAKRTITGRTFTRAS